MTRRRWLGGVGTKPEGWCRAALAPQPEFGVRERGHRTGLTSPQVSPKPGTPGQGGHRAPTLARNWRREPRRNRGQLPEGSAGGSPMLVSGQRGRRRGGSDAPPGSRATPWQGEGPQPSARESKRGRIARGGHHGIAEALSLDRGMLAGESRRRGKAPVRFGKGFSKTAWGEPRMAY
jgi:hypothetical protein